MRTEDLPLLRPKLSLAVCYSSADVINATTSWHLTSVGVGDNDESDRVWLERTPLVLRPQSRIYEPQYLTNGTMSTSVASSQRYLGPLEMV